MTSRPNSAATHPQSAPTNGAGSLTAHARSDRAKHLRMRQPEDKRDVAKRLRLALELDGTTQDFVAIACGIHPSLVSDWHNDGEPAAPNAIHAARAAEAGLRHWPRAVGCEARLVVVDEPEGARTHRITEALLAVPVVVTAHLANDGRRDAYERGQERARLLKARAEIELRLALLDSEDASERAGR